MRDCLISQEGDCLISREGDCLISQEGDCLISREGDCLISQGSDYPISQQSDYLISQEGDSLGTVKRVTPWEQSSRQDVSPPAKGGVLRRFDRRELLPQQRGN